MIEQNISLWQKVRPVKFIKATKDTQADVCVVGAGIAGLSIAYMLLKAGKSVIVLEAHEIGAGESSLTSGHLSNALDEGYVKLQKLFGVDGAKLAAESHTQAIDIIENIVKTEHIDCDFERIDGYLISDQSAVLEKELEAAHQASLQEVSFTTIKLTPKMDSVNCLRFPKQGQLHIMKYLNGLAQAIVARGGTIFTNTPVASVDEKESVIVKTEHNVVVCGAAVIATNTPFIDRFAMHTKQAAYRSYVIGLSIAKGAVKKALYWDTKAPYHYVRVVDADSKADILLVGGEDHKTGQANDAALRFSHLHDWAQAMFGIEGTVEFTWSGQVMEPIDGLAFIGRNPGNKNIYIVTGDSGHGLTHGTIAGILVTDLIQGKQNPWEQLYAPSRKNIRAFGQFLKETCNVAWQYTDHFKRADVDSEKDIKPGSGAIIKKGFKKVAVYKNEQGELHSCSAICPHLGCVVAWNGSEKTWDCPCHGSRFTATGSVINGPATDDLAAE